MNGLMNTEKVRFEGQQINAIAIALERILDLGLGLGLDLGGRARAIVA